MQGLEGRGGTCRVWECVVVAYAVASCNARRTAERKVRRTMRLEIGGGRPPGGSIPHDAGARYGPSGVSRR